MQNPYTTKHYNAVKEFEKQYRKSLSKYGKVVFGPQKKYEKVTLAFTNMNKAMLELLVSEGRVEAPTPDQLIRCMFDLMHQFVNNGIALPDATEYSKEVMKQIDIANNEYISETTTIH